MSGVDIPPDAGWWALAITGLPLIGGGLRWWLARRDRIHRQRKDDFYQRNKAWADDLAQRERKLDAKLQEQGRACEDELREVRGEMERVKRLAERACMGVVLLAQETNIANPGSVALATVRSLLAGAVPLDFTTPPDIASLLRSLDVSQGRATA